MFWKVRDAAITYLIDCQINHAAEPNSIQEKSVTNRNVSNSRQSPHSIKFGLAFSLCLVSLINVNSLCAQSDSDAEALERVTQHIRYLASDELGGRQPGTPGMELAEKYILDEYKKIGLKPFSEETGFIQPFGVGKTRKLDKEGTSLVLNGPDGMTMELELDEQFRPQTSREDFDVTGSLVFVGYGIKATEHNYNEYEDVDLEGKIVVMIRMEPQQDDEDSVFDGTENSRYAYIRTKANAMRRAGAAGILMVNDSRSAPNAEQDELPASDLFGNQRVPFAAINRAVLDKVLTATPLLKGDGTKFSTLAEAEADIDRNLEPLSQDIKGWTCDLKAGYSENETIANNLIGVIEGEGPLKDEVIILGGHHDHLGMGSYGSRSNRREIHNGADDNATGTAGVMELARRFAARDTPPKRTMVFICFSAEEMGLLGAQHYCKNPVYPLESTAAMINYDMIGWLRNKKLTVFNWNSSAAFGPVLKSANKGFDLNLDLPPNGFGGSDHLPFFQRDVPVMFIHTGLTDTYHTPEDDFETIDCAGALQVINYTEAVLDGLVNLEAAPQFADRDERVEINKAMAEDSTEEEATPTTPARVRIGVKWDDDWDDEMEEEIGVRVEALMDDSIAAAAGFQEGDICTEFAGEAVTTRRQIVMAVRRKTGKKVTVKLLRDEEELEIDLMLAN